MVLLMKVSDQVMLLGSLVWQNVFLLCVSVQIHFLKILFVHYFCQQQ